MSLLPKGFGVVKSVLPGAGARSDTSAPHPDALRFTYPSSPSPRTTPGTLLLSLNGIATGLRNTG